MVALEMKKEVAVANSDEQTGKMKKEKRRKATQPEREVISIIEESEGGVKKERKKKKKVEVPVKIEEGVAEGKKHKMKNKSVQSEHPVENIKVEDGEKVGAEEEVQKKLKKGHDGHNVKEMNGIGQETSKKKKKTLACKYSAEVEGNEGEVVCNSVKGEGSEGKEQRKKKKMKNKSVQSEPPVENIKVEDEENVGAEEEVLKKAKKKQKKGQIVASAACTQGTEEMIKGMKKGKKRIAAEQDLGEGMSAKKKKMVKKELVEDKEGFIIPKVEIGAVEGGTVKKKRRKAATMEGEQTLEEAETLEVKHQVKKKRKNKKAEAITQEDSIIEEVKSEQKSKKKGLKEKSEKNKGLKKKSEKTNEPKDESEKKKGSKEKSVKKKGLKKKQKAPVCAEEEQVIIVEQGQPKEKRKKKREAVLSVVDEEVLDQPTEVSVEGQSGELLNTMAGGIKGKKKRKNPSGVEIKVEEEAEEDDGKKGKKNIKVEQCDSEKQQGQEVASHMDVVFLSKKHGNTDEVTINQQRRLALQMEVDKASQPQTQPASSGLGQWANAQFDSSTQQQKFLRLMGGFKKGAQPAGSIAGRANMALGKEAQENLQQALQGEFEQAQSRRMDFNNRGSGLGFAAPSNKKFAIDVHACRSVRFDD